MAWDGVAWGNWATRSVGIHYATTVLLAMTWYRRRATTKVTREMLHRGLRGDIFDLLGTKGCDKCKFGVLGVRHGDLFRL